MAENLSSAAIKDLREDVTALKSAISDLTRNIKGVGEGAVKDTRGRAAAAAAGFRSGFDEATRAAKETGRRSADAARSTVTHYPMQSVLVAFGAGLIIAQLLKRR